MDDKGDMRMRAIDELALATEIGSHAEQAVQAAYLAGVEPYEIAELGGLRCAGCKRCWAGWRADGAHGRPSRTSAWRHVVAIQWPRSGQSAGSM